MKKILIAISVILISYTMVGQVNRDKMPESGEIPSINFSSPQIHKFENGLTLMIVENHKLPVVSLRLTMDRGATDLKDKVGISELTSVLMSNGSKHFNKDYFNEMIEFLGADISLSAKSGWVSSLSRYFERVFELFADAALNPNFTQEELDKERKKELEVLKSGENSPQAVANRVNQKLVYTEKHPYGKLKTQQSLNNITLDDIKSYYKENFSPENAYMIVVGDIKASKAIEIVGKYFGKWKNRKVKNTLMIEPQDVDFTQVNLIDMPNAVQSEINIFNLQELKMSDDDLFAVLVMNYILGGGFGSYINMNLREKHAFTYGAGSHIGIDKWTKSTFSVSTKVRNQVTARAVEEILKEIDRIQNQLVDQDKLNQAKSQYLGSFILSTESPSFIANTALNVVTQNLPKDFYKNYIKNISKVTAEDVKRVANKYIKPNQLRIVIVGKKDEIVSDLQKLEYNKKSIPVYFFDKEAKLVN